MTFARLLNKVSSEMSSGSEMDTNNSCGGVSSVSITVGGVPVNPSSPTSELKSPHSTSSNQGSDSLSSSEITLALPTSGITIPYSSITFIQLKLHLLDINYLHFHLTIILIIKISFARVIIQLNIPSGKFYSTQICIYYILIKKGRLYT